MSLEILAAQRRPGFYAIALCGRLDGATTPECETRVFEVLAQKPKMLVFDLAGLDYISSIGIRLMLQVRKTMERAGGEAAMVNLQPQIKKVFEIVSIFPESNMFSHIDEADRYFERIQRLWR